MTNNTFSVYIIALSSGFRLCWMISITVISLIRVGILLFAMDELCSPNVKYILSWKLFHGSLFWCRMTTMSKHAVCGFIAVNKQNSRFIYTQYCLYTYRISVNIFSNLRLEQIDSGWVSGEINRKRERERAKMCEQEWKKLVINRSIMCERRSQWINQIRELTLFPDFITHLHDTHVSVRAAHHRSIIRFSWITRRLHIQHYYWIANDMCINAPIFFCHVSLIQN